MEVIVFCYISVTLAYIFSKRKAFFFSPTLLFMSFQLVIFLGSLQYIDMEIEADRINMVVMLWAQLGVIIGATLVDSTRTGKRSILSAFSNEELIVDSENQTKDFIIIAICFVSIIVSAAYFAAIGYNVFVLSMKSLAFQGTVLQGVADLRLAAYAGDRYFAPGYVNQFKNTLFPLLTAYLLIAYSVGVKKISRAGLITLIILNFTFLAGTGQRGPFVLAVIITFVFINITLERKKRWKFNIVILLVSLCFFLLLSVILGRTVKSVSEINVTSLVSMITSRMFNENQSAAVVGFRLVYNEEPTWGNDWWNVFLGILPMQSKYISLDSRIFKIFYGSTRGTSPPSIWGSVWYNFGAVGVLIFPVIFGVAYQRIYYRLVAGKKTLDRLACYAALIVILGYWTAGSPYVLLNKGLIAVILLRFLFKFSDKLRIRIRARKDVRYSNATDKHIASCV